MKPLLFISLIISSLTSYTQMSLVDSMKLELRKPNLTINQRTEALSEIIWDCAYNGDPKEGTRYSDTLKLLGKINRDKEVEGLGYLRAANCYQKLDNDSMTLLNYNGAISLFKACGQLRRQVVTYQNLSMYYSRKSRYSEAIEVLDWAIAIGEAENNPVFTSACYNSKGVNQMELTDYDGATQSYFKAMKAFEELKDTLNIAVAMSNIAIVHNRIGAHDKAFEIYQKTEALYKSLGKMTFLADNYGNLGNTLLDMGREEDAMHHYNLSIQLSDSIGYEDCVARQQLNKGDLLLTQQKLIEAYPILYSSMQYFQRIDGTKNLAEAHLNMADFYVALTPEVAAQLHLPYKNQTDSIHYHCSKAIDYSQQVGGINLTAEGYEKRSKAFASIGDFENALNDYAAFITYRDSSLNEEKTIAVARNQMKFDFEKKELQLQADAEKSRLRKNAAIGVGGALVIFLVIAWGFYKRRRDLELKATEKEFQFAVSDTEMKALRSQMNPHFIFNALNSIADFIRKNESEIADDYLAKFARLMRLVLENSEKQEVPIEKDMEALSLYLSLEQLRMKDKFTYTISIDKDVDQENTLIPPLILQPFVENSIWHGISKKEGNGHIQISIIHQNDELLCTVRDDGVGRNLEHNGGEKTIRKSLGMKITQERLNILNQIKNRNAEMKIFDLPNGTRVEINLPLSTNF